MTFCGTYVRPVLDVGAQYLWDPDGCRAPLVVGILRSFVGGWVRNAHRSLRTQRREVGEGPEEPVRPHPARRGCVRAGETRTVRAETRCWAPVTS